MSNQAVPGIYTWVINDVVEKMSRRFAELGLDENVLSDLKQMWEDKIRRMGVAPFVAQAPSMIPTENQMYVPYQMMPKAEDMNFNYGDHMPYMGQNYNIPQNDGANDQEHSDLQKKLDQEILAAKAPKVKQLDGEDSDDDEDDENDGGDSEGIGSDLDDDEDDENAPTDHLILCQYEKVTRIKNKWKCTLKDGIVNINGRDYVFNRAGYNLLLQDPQYEQRVVTTDIKNQLFVAINFRNSKAMFAYLSYGINLNFNFEEFGTTPLLLAVTNDYFAGVKMLIGFNADLNCTDSECNTIIHRSAYLRSPKMIKYLLTKGARLDALKSDGSSALHVAAQVSNFEVCEIIINSKMVGVNLKNNEGMTALHKVVSSLHPYSITVAKLLILSGANINDVDQRHRTPLHEATIANHVEMCKLLVENGATIDCQDIDGSTPLHYAVIQDFSSLCEFLVKIGADKNLKNKSGSTPLDYLCPENLPMAELRHIFRQVQTGAVVFALYVIVSLFVGLLTGKFLFFLTIIVGIFAVVMLYLYLMIKRHFNIGDQNLAQQVMLDDLPTEILIQIFKIVSTSYPNGIFVMNQVNSRFRNILDKHKYIWDPVGIKLIKQDAQFEEGSHFDELYVDREYLIFTAISFDNPKVLMALIKAGYDINQAMDNIGLTPLHLAVLLDCMPTFDGFVFDFENVDLNMIKFDRTKFLVEHGADVNATTRIGMTPLHLAADQGRLEICQLLVRSNSEIDASTTIDGQTPLHKAAKLVHEQSVKTAELLLKHGANIHCRDHHGYTPLHLAVIHSNVDMCKLFFDWDAFPDILDVDGASPLHHASFHGRKEICKLLVEHGANIHLPDSLGYTPLDYTEKQDIQLTTIEPEILKTEMPKKCTKRKRYKC
ncbi:hypothetical protein HDV06_004291 [Boothiomyces sp. JEL0866]|nr:hypothetical protein HDV06_004291 [Boothiomyces sp. JEL0866]